MTRGPYHALPESLLCGLKTIGFKTQLNDSVIWSTAAQVRNALLTSYSLPFLFT